MFTNLGGIRPYLLLALLCLALYLPGLASVPPIDRDESRFAQASHQMLESSDYIRIQFQDEVRAKKPAGIYWLQAASAHIFQRSGVVVIPDIIANACLRPLGLCWRCC